MKMYIAFASDYINREVLMASQANKPDEIRKLMQAIERGNKIWSSWVESYGGNVVYLGGPEGRVEIESDRLNELPKIRREYNSALGSHTSVGVGMTVYEADQALLASKLTGGDRITLFTDHVKEILSQIDEESQKEDKFKVKEEHLDPSSGLRKEEMKVEIPEEVKKAPSADYESLFHEVAQTPAPKKEEKAEENPEHEELKSGIVKILQAMKGHAPELEKLQGKNPDLYRSLTNMTQAMIAMGRQLFTKGPEKIEQSPEEIPRDSNELDKAALKPGSTGKHQTKLGPGSQIDPSASGMTTGNHKGGQIKVLDPETMKAKWKSVRSNLVMDQQNGTPKSSRSE